MGTGLLLRSIEGVADPEVVDVVVQGSRHFGDGIGPVSETDVLDGESFQLPVPQKAIARGATDRKSVADEEGFLVKGVQRNESSRGDAMGAIDVDALFLAAPVAEHHEVVILSGQKFFQGDA